MAKIKERKTYFYDTNKPRSTYRFRGLQLTFIVGIFISLLTE